MKKRRLNEDEELLDEQPTKEETSSTESNSAPKPTLSSNLSSIIQSEVNKQLAKYKGDG